MSKPFNSSKPLVRAAGTGNTQEVTRLLDAGADSEARDDKDWSALQAASYCGQLPVITELIRRGAAVNAANKNGRTALHVASQQGHVDVTRVLLQAGADPATASNNGRTALHVASQQGHVDVTRVLLQAGADPATASNNGFTALHAASQNGHVDVTRVLLQAGADPAAASIEGHTALHAASQEGHVDVTRVLLQAGADPAAASTEGGTALHQASQNGHVDVTRVLLQAGADVHAAKNNGVTALHVASGRGHLVVASTLLQAGADINALTTNGTTPLMLAADEGRVGTVNLLLQRGSDMRLKTRAGRTALMRAEEKGHTEVVHLLKLHARGEQLPPIVTQPGEWDPNKIWSYHEKMRLIQACIMRILFAGTYENGKSSLARSLLKNAPLTTYIDDRTIVVDFKPWQVTENKTVTLYDLGGHQCYQAIAHLFFADAANNLAIIVHKITSTEFINTWKWITDILTHAPGCAILLVLTMIDLVDEEDLQSLKQQFKKELIACLQREVERLKLKCTKDKRKIVQRLEQLSADIKNETIIYTLSCISGSGLSKLQEGLYKMMEDGQFKVEMTEYAFLLYTDIGVIGKEIEEKELQARKVTIPKAKKGKSLLNMLKSIPSKFKIKKPTTQPQHTAVSSSVSLTDKNNHEQAAVSSSVSLTDRNNHEQAAISSSVSLTDRNNHEQEEEQSKLKFLDKSDVLQKFSARYSASMNVEDILNSSLAKLHSLGLVQWYNTPALENIIFNDLASFINMLKCIFQHEVKIYLGYDKVTEQMKQMILKLGKTKYQQYLHTLCSQGLLSQELLKILASQFGFENNSEILVKLLCHLELIYQIPVEETSIGDQENWLFFPHYVDSVEIPPDVRDQLQNLTSYEKGYFTFHGRIEGFIPSSFFNLLCVGIYNLLLVGVYDQRREVWKQNLFAEVGDTILHLEHIQNQALEGITINIKCELKQSSVSKLWEFVTKTQREAEKLQKTWWPGLVTDTTLSCPHCGIKGTAAQLSKNWPLVDVVAKFGVPGEVCSCIQDGHQCKFPRALLYPLPQDEDKAEKCIQELSDYMEQNCNVAPVTEDFSKCPAEIQTHISDDETDTSLMTTYTDASTSKATDDQTDTSLMTTHTEASTSKDTDDETDTSLMTTYTDASTSKDTDDQTDTSLVTMHIEASTIKDTDDQTDTGLMTTHTEASTIKVTDDQTDTSLMTTHTEASTIKVTDAKGSEKPSQVNLTSETCPDITDVATLESTQVQANQLQQVLSTQLKEMEDRLMQPFLALSQQMYMQGKFHAEQADINKMQLAQHADQIHMESAVHAEQIHMESAVHAEQIHMESTVHAEQIHMESAVHADQIHMESAVHAEQIHMESAVHAEQIHMESAVHAEQIQKKSAEHADQIHKELANKVALDAGDASALETDYTHPVLQTNKALLEKYLCVTDDLLTKLFTEGLLWKEQMAKIQGQGSESGQRKLLLLFLDRHLDSDSDLHFDKFIQSCIDSNSPANVALVERINYDF